MEKEMASVSATLFFFHRILKKIMTNAQVNKKHDNMDEIIVQG